MPAIRTSSLLLLALLGLVTLAPIEASALGADRIEKCQVAFSPRGDALQAILQELKATRTRVDVGVYYLTNDHLVDAMCHLASQANVSVRVFVDKDMSKAAHRKALDKLTHYGATVYVENLPRNGKLHLKSAVIDEHTVITGSANWTETSFAYNGEDTVIIRSKPLAQHYLATYDWLAKHSATYEGKSLEDMGKVSFPKAKKMSRSNRDERLVAPKMAGFFDVRAVEVYFSPQAPGLERFLHTLRSAQRSIDISIYMVTHPAIIDTLCEIARAKRCKIRMIADDTMISGNRLAHMQTLWDADIDLWYLEASRASLHTKNCIIDGRYIWSGSANWTSGAAERNCEDMIFFNSMRMGRHYTDFFEYLLTHAKPFAGIERGQAAEASQQPTFALGLKKAGEVHFPDSLPPTRKRQRYGDAEKRSKTPAFTVNGAVEYLDDEEYLPVLLDLITTARQSILVSMYHVAKGSRSTTVDEVLDELGQAAERGVYVYLLLNIPDDKSDSQHRVHSGIAEELRARGVDVRLDVPGITLHEKMVVVDLCKILIGSHNWSEGALTGEAVFESSAFILLNKQDVRFAKHILKHNIISDMRSKEMWEKEISLLRHIGSLRGDERKAFVRQLGGTN